MKKAQDGGQCLRSRRKTEEADAAGAEPAKKLEARLQNKQTAAADARAQNEKKPATQTVEKTLQETETDEAKRLRALIAGKGMIIIIDNH